MNTFAKPMQPRDSRALREVEAIVRDFFLEQFSEKPRLLKLEYRGNSIHVHGYRPIALAELRLNATGAKAAQFQKYHNELFKAAERALNQKLQKFFGNNIGAVHCSFDPAQHEFEILVEVLDLDWMNYKSQTEHRAHAC